MAYIDLDEINRLHPKLTAKYPLSFANGISVAVSEINRLPNADVVPKSEVERLKHILNCYALQYGTVTDQQKVIDEAKREAAREIFEDIEEEIKLALDSNYKARSQVELSDELYHNVNGKISALRGIEDFVAERKKKYPEGK